jgi:hypothetical protein
MTLKKYEIWLTQVDEPVVERVNPNLYSSQNVHESVSSNYDEKSERVVNESRATSVRPFFAPLTTLKKELGDELWKKDTEISLSVHWGMFI